MNDPRAERLPAFVIECSAQVMGASKLDRTYQAVAAVP
jgi:hypothetical protein